MEITDVVNGYGFNALEDQFWNIFCCFCHRNQLQLPTTCRQNTETSIFATSSASLFWHHFYSISKIPSTVAAVNLDSTVMLSEIDKRV